MSSLKDALARVTRVARQVDLLRQNQKLRPPPPKTPVSPPKHVQLPARDRVPKHQLDKLRPHLRGFQKKRYQRFLEPLAMPQLKIYSDNGAPYNAKRAEANLASKKSTDRIDVFNNFLSDRFVFNKMVDFLVELTPDYLKSPDTLNNQNLLASVLKEETTEFMRNRYANVPRYHFHEVPPIPNPLTKENFQEYIYFLTHLKILYRNSSSLTSGIVPEILLYTHHLDNAEFKPYRSTQTYNYLIKYFGYDKFQNSFARELLLVMSKDGHLADIETINQLLKICRIHSNRRSLVSTYEVVIKYLTLAKRLDLKVNLSTWNRVYDCIGNIFLKELLVNKISAICLPVLNNLCIRILEDYSKTTKSRFEVAKFVETDLCCPNWKLNSRLAEKVMYHAVVNAANNQEFGVIWNELISTIAMDGVTLKTLINGIFANPDLENRVHLALCAYIKTSDKVNVPAEVFGSLIQRLCRNEDNYDIVSILSIVRSLIHIDAVDQLRLPVEYIEYEKAGNSSQKADKNTTILAATTPQLPIPEHYKILKRLTRHHLIDLEAKAIYIQGTQPELAMPWEQILEKEAKLWKEQKSQIEQAGEFWNDISSTSLVLGLQPQTVCVPEQVVSTYKRLANTKMGISHDINLIRKLKSGFDNLIEHEMFQRNIISRPPVNSGS